MTPQRADWPVWDWPVRIIHWYFPIAIAFMWWSGEEGKMQWHSWVGYSLLVAAATRLLWGLVGSYHARFTTFLRGPSAVLAYLRGQRFDGVGHNPVGGWSTLLLLSLVFTQALSGLFSADDILFEGPFAYWAGDWSDALTEWHEVNWGILQVLIAVHLGAIAFYQRVKKQAMVQTMWFGRSEGRRSEAPPRPAWLALLIALVLAGVLLGLISVAPEAPSYY